MGNITSTETLVCLRELAASVQLRGRPGTQERRGRMGHKYEYEIKGVKEEERLSAEAVARRVGGVGDE